MYVDVPLALVILGGTKAVILGFQHFIVMLGTTIIIPTMLVPQMGGGNEEKARVIQTLLFVVGINTLLQTFFGSRHHVVMGNAGDRRYRDTMDTIKHAFGGLPQIICKKGSVQELRLSFTKDLKPSPRLAAISLLHAYRRAGIFPDPLLGFLLWWTSCLRLGSQLPCLTSSYYGHLLLPRLELDGNKGKSSIANGNM